MAIDLVMLLNYHSSQTVTCLLYVHVQKKYFNLLASTCMCMNIICWSLDTCTGYVHMYVHMYVQYMTKVTYVYPQRYAREFSEYWFNIRAVNRKLCQSSMRKPTEITHTRHLDQLNRVQVRTFRWTAPPSYTFLREEPLNVATSMFGVIVHSFVVAPLNGCLCLYFSFLGALRFLKHYSGGTQAVLTIYP